MTLTMRTNSRVDESPALSSPDEKTGKMVRSLNGVGTAAFASSYSASASKDIALQFGESTQPPGLMNETRRSYGAARTRARIAR